MAKYYKKLGELLVEYGYINLAQLNEAINKQKNSSKRLGEILVDMKYLQEDDLMQMLEFQLGVSRVNLANYIFGPHLSHYIPEHVARRYNAVALEEEGEFLKVAMSDPTNLVAVDDIEITSGMKVKPMIASRKAIYNAINQIYSISDENTEDIIASLNDTPADYEPEIEDLKEMVEDAPIVRLANLIISQAIQMRVSDIHIEPQENDVKVRYRIDGVLRDHMHTPKYAQAALISRLKIIADLDITQRRVPQDGRINMNFNGHRVDMRVSTLPTIFGENVVIRLLTKDENLIDLERLGFSEQNYHRFKSLIDQPYGIILVTGPTGSGKSTSLFAALNYLNSPDKKIVTIEDPVEYQLSGVNQTQANKKTGLTFARALRAVLRQDPDIVMIGEIRDEETASIAVRAALTGHLVLSTLHTNDAASSITRLIDMGIPPYLVASTVIGVVAQRLIRRLCNNCKKEYSPENDQKRYLGLEEGEVIYQEGACNRCSSTGYIGRVAVHEVLRVDHSIKEMIVNNASEREIKNYALENDMKNLREDGIYKVKKGITSWEELMKITV